MIRVIMGLKGSGKTKQLIDAVHDVLDHASGDVVCIEYGILRVNEELSNK